MEQVRNKTSSKYLSIEVILITVISIGICKLLLINFDSEAMMALIVPVILVSAAIIPTLIRKSDLSQIGFNIGNIRLILRLHVITCVAVFTVLLCGIMLLDHYKVLLPMRPIIPERRLYIWFCYQFLFAAVPEELFFRGYLQSNIINILNTVAGKKSVFLSWCAIFISAMVFAVSHAVLLGNVISLITFFPGLILGWLFFRTNSLLAPILFHGIANIGYAVIAGLIA